MNNLVLDGSWTPLYFNWQLLIALEIVTTIMEFLVLWAYNVNFKEKEQKWTTLEVFLATLMMNLVSFSLCLPFILTYLR